jgi:hypothetical protein
MSDLIPEEAKIFLIVIVSFWIGIFIFLGFIIGKCL